MTPNEVKQKFEQLDLKRGESARRSLTDIARRLTQADGITDDDLRSLDATLKAAGISRDEFMSMVGVINHHPILVATVERMQQENPQAMLRRATAKLDSLKAQRDKTNQTDRDGRQNLRGQMAEALTEIEQAKAKVRQFDLAKKNLAKFEAENALLLAGGR